MKTIIGSCFVGLGLSVLPATAAITIPTLAVGDGHYHNELGTAYDFFDSTAASVFTNRYFSGTSDSINDYIGYAQFSLDSVPDGATVSNATLHVYLISRGYADESPSAGFINHVANSSAANGNASQRLEGSELVVEIKDQTIGWLALDVTSYLQSDIDNNYSWSAFSFNPNNAGYFDNANFSVASFESGANGMFLSIDLVPEPSVFILSLLGFGMIRRRR